MCGWVDGDNMRIWPNAAFPDFGDIRAFDTEDRHNASFPGYIKAVHSRIERQHVRVLADVERLHDPSSAHIEYKQLVIALTGDKGKPVRRIDQQSVVVVGTRERNPCDDPVDRRVDFNEFIARLNVDKDVMRL